MDAKPTDDADLLREFAASHSQPAFRTLVERYQDMVFGTARRRLGNDEAAFDVAQNVFAALAKKAPWLSARTNVGGWLYKSTLMEAARRQRDDLRRYKRERLYAEEMNIRGTNDENEDEPQLKELTPVLDDALQKLSDSDREAILLRFFRGLSLRDTGVALGTTEEAARKRVSRALDKLNTMFKRKGVVMPTALLAAAALPKMASNAAVPAGFAAKAAAAAAATPPPGVLATAFLKAAALSKTQIAAAVVLAAAAPITYQAGKIYNLRQDQAALESRIELLAARQAKPATVSPRAMPAASSGVAVNTAPPAAPATAPAKPNKDKWGKWSSVWELERKYQKEARLGAITSQLGLSEEQVLTVSKAFEKASADRQALRNSGQPSTPQALSAIEQEQDDRIAEVLSEKQRQDYRDFLARETENRQEIYAARQLSEMQGFLILSDDQKDKLWNLFSTEAAQNGGDHWSFTQELTEEREAALRGILDETQVNFWKERSSAIRESMRHHRPPAGPPTP